MTDSHPEEPEVVTLYVVMNLRHPQWPEVQDTFATRDEALENLRVLSGAMPPEMGWDWRLGTLTFPN